MGGKDSQPSLAFYGVGHLHSCLVCVVPRVWPQFGGLGRGERREVRVIFAGKNSEEGGKKKEKRFSCLNRQGGGRGAIDITQSPV
jgi:hypothetical protein